MTALARRDLAAMALLALAAVPVGVSALRLAYDDAWITYRYAENLAGGHGFVYNLGERFLGTTAPGYALLLAVPGAFVPESIPVASGVFNAVSLAAAGVGLYVFGRLSGHRLGGLVAGAIFIVNPVSVETFGGEMLLQAALAIWSFVAQAAGRPTRAVLLACAATVVRPDGLLVLAIVGLHETWKGRRLPWTQIAVSAVVLGVWFGALWLYFGAPLPQTLGAKHAQRASGVWRPLFPDLIAWLGALSAHGPTVFGSRPAPGFTALLYIAALGVPALLWMRHWLALLLWPAAFLLAYWLLEVPFYHWYALPPILAIAAAAAAAAEAASSGLTLVLRRVFRRHDSASTLPGAIAAAACLIAIGLAVGPLGRFTLALGQDAPYPVERAYIAIGQWLERETPPSASVGYLEIGIVGYHARRTVIDPLGLVNPGVAAHVAGRDFLYAYRTHRPDVIVHNPIFFPDLLGVLLEEPWFKAEYERVTTLDSGQGEPVTIYRRRQAPQADALELDTIVWEPGRAGVLRNEEGAVVVISSRVVAVFAACLW